MKELFGQILMQVRGAWRFRWWALAAVWGVALAGWLFVLRMPDEYESRTRVYVDTDSVLKPLLSGLAVNSDVTNRVGMMSRVLMGRPNLERVARETDLYLRAPTSTDFERLVGQLSVAIKLEGGGADNTYTIRYADNDPAMAKRVVRKLLDTFVEDSLGVKRADSDSAQKFIEGQIKEYEQRLRAAEDRLATFKQQNVGLMPGQTGDYYSQLQTSMGSLEELRARYRLASERSKELSKQIDGEEPTFGLFSEGDGSDAATDGQIADYRRQLDQLLLQYTERHPRVEALKETIAELESQKSTRQKSPRRGGGPVPRDLRGAANLALDINPVYQNLKMELSRVQVELAELRQQIGEREAQVASLRTRVNNVPETEAELTRLNRDYEVNKAQHTALLQRLESARLSERAESSTEQVRFRIIEPPTEPLIPIGPQRNLLMTGVLLAALGAGFVLAFFLNQLKPVFLSRGMLASITGLPVLGAISFAPPRSTVPLFRRDPVLVSAAGAGLVFLYLLGVVLAEPASRLLRTITG
jgi:polysaccharide chain length determinant protein (PEP-CTERM system associated)